MNAGALRVLALLEATSISGTAKAVLEMAYEAQADASGQRKIQIIAANFSRGNTGSDNALTRALKSARIPYALIQERGRFDSSVLGQIQDLVRKYEAQVVWTNSVKSHFLVKQSKIQHDDCKWVAFHHGYTSTDFKMRLYNQLDRMSLRKADRVLTVCIPFAEQMEARGVRRSKIRVQHMPVRPFVNSPGDVTKLRAELKLPPAARVILSVGRLSHEKGHAVLIEAFAQLSHDLRDGNLWLVLVGDGPERVKLERQAKECGAGGQIIFTGHRDDAKVFYGMADLFVLPSFTEGTPNVLLEAMSAGVPIVATAVGGVPELATNERTALLAPPSSPAELARALRKLLDSMELRNELSQAAKQVAQGHSPRSYFLAMREIFLEVAAE